MFVIIIDRSGIVSREVTPELATLLVARGLIWFCSRCQSFHPRDGISWAAVETHIQGALN